MHESFRAFMSGLIDYAGLFPPAQLPMKAAAENYLRYRAGDDEWMLGRFVCPAARLKELLEQAPDRETDLELPVSAVLRGGATGAEFLDTLAEDLAAALAAVRSSGERVHVGSFEARVPTGILATRDPVAIAEFLGEVLTQIRASTSHMPSMYFEAPATGAWEGTLEPVIEGLLEAQTRELEENSADPASLGFKLRCGGAAAADSPGDQAVAHVIGTCILNDVPLKCTAGLHHPIRRIDKLAGAWTHGFFNVFAATLLASVHRLDARQLLPLLRESDPAAFRFEGDTFSVAGLELTAKEIADHRELACSFGSCSFDEPREDLRALGWLEPAAVSR